MKQDTRVCSPSNDRHSPPSLPYLSTSLRRYRRPRHPWLPSSLKNTVTTMVRPKPGGSRILIMSPSSRAVCSSAARAMGSSSTCPMQRSNESLSATRRHWCPVCTPRHRGEDDREPGGRHAATVRSTRRAEGHDGTCSTHYAGHPLEACRPPHTREGAGCVRSKRKSLHRVGKIEQGKRLCDHEERLSCV